jgi:hypothetical protein
VAEREGRELLCREQAYRQGRPFPEVAGKVVIVVDDGLATGSSMRAAVEALRRLGPARIVVAVPAAPESTCRELNALAEEVVCAVTPSPFFAVGESYWDFTQTTDEEVRDLLRAAPGSRRLAHFSEWPWKRTTARSAVTARTGGNPPRPAGTVTHSTPAAPRQRVVHGHRFKEPGRGGQYRWWPPHLHAERQGAGRRSARARKFQRGQGS